MKPNAKDAHYGHEDYSAEIVRHVLKDVIEGHPANGNYGFTADDVVALIEGSENPRGALFWRELIQGPIDADRMDYLLRDSHHAGVDYGRFDWHRLAQTVQAVPGVNGGSPTLGVSEGGFHAAESLILARYFMFTQVYFHKTRLAYDHHLKEALQEILPGGRWALPTPEKLDEYLAWDDWRVLGALKGGAGGAHGRRILARDHYREIWHTPEVPGDDGMKQLEERRKELNGLDFVEIPAKKSWYNPGAADIPVLMETLARERKPLSDLSSVVRGIQPIRQFRLYVCPQDRAKAERLLNRNGGENG